MEFCCSNTTDSILLEGQFYKVKFWTCSSFLSIGMIKYFHQKQQVRKVYILI